MNANILDNSTLWVSISFILFVILAFKPLFNQFSDGLEKKIDELRKSLEESKNLKEEAEKTLQEQLNKQKDNEKLIDRIQKDTKDEIDKIKKQLDKEIEQNMLRKINNYSQLSSQMESKLKNELKKEIIEKVVKYTEFRIKNNLSKNFNKKLIDDSLKNIPKQFF
jgi:F-type H+-transporting ATPase subunit b